MLTVPIISQRHSGLRIEDGLGLLSGGGLHSGLGGLNLQPSWSSPQWHRSKLAGMAKAASTCESMAANHVSDAGGTGPEGLGSRRLHKLAWLAKRFNMLAVCPPFVIT